MRLGIYNLGDLQKIPGLLNATDTYLFSYIQGAGIDNKELADDWIVEFQDICTVLIEN